MEPSADERTVGERGSLDPPFDTSMVDDVHRGSCRRMGRATMIALGVPPDAQVPVGFLRDPLEEPKGIIVLRVA